MRAHAAAPSFVMPGYGVGMFSVWLVTLLCEFVIVGIFVGYFGCGM